MGKAEWMLKTARRRAGLTQRELARRARVPQPTISRIERGIVSPSVDTLDRLLRNLGMDWELIDRADGNNQRGLASVPVSLLDFLEDRFGHRLRDGLLAVQDLHPDGLAFAEFRC